MAIVQGHEFPDRLLYDVDNQIWYEPLADGNVRAGFTAWATTLMGDMLVFTPKRIGKEFEKNRSFAVVEGGKWVGAARAAFDGVVVAHNEMLIRKPGMLNKDAYGEAWMLIVRPSQPDWRTALTSGESIGPVLEAWFSSEAYKQRAE